MLKEFDEIKGRRKNLENIQNKIETLMKRKKNESLILKII